MKSKSEELFLQLFALRYRAFREKNIAKYLEKIETELEDWIKSNYKIKFKVLKEISVQEMKKELLKRIKVEYPEIKSIEEAFIEVKMQNDFDVEFSKDLKRIILEQEADINNNIRKLYKDIYKDNEEKNNISIEDIETKVVEYYKTAGFKVHDKVDIYCLK